MEAPDTIHGRMKEGAHLAGYSLQRSMENLRWLLEDSRYEQLSEGYTNVNDFLRGIQPAFTLLNIKPEERKQIAELIKEQQPEASQRAIADMVGVSDVQIGRDLGKNYGATNVAPEDNFTEKNNIDNATNVAPAIPADDFDPVKQARKKHEKEEKAKERNQEREQKLASVPDAPIFVGNFETGNLYQADVCRSEFINQLPENSIDLIVTDPPWDEDALRTYKAAADIAMRVLKPGHFLAIYSGKMFLPEILDTLREAGLIYIWQFSVYQPDSNDRINKYHLYSTHRPVFLMQKPGDRIDMVWMPDSVKSTRDKRFHEWGQGIEIVEKIINAYTQPGDIVLDPFIGGASVPFVAKTHKRKYIGFDISGDAIRLGLARLQNEQ